MEAENEQNQVEVEGAHEAANASDNKQPHHYDPAKQDVKSESELFAEAIEIADSKGEQVDVETTHHGEEPVLAQPPEEFTGIKYSSAKDYAGGIPAVLAVAQHTLEEMDPLRSAKTLLKVNQKGGFDCMSCVKRLHSLLQS